MLMHTGVPGDKTCKETCVYFNFFRTSLACGGCRLNSGPNAPVTTVGTPIMSPVVPPLVSPVAIPGPPAPVVIPIVTPPAATPIISPLASPFAPVPVVAPVAQAGPVSSPVFSPPVAVPVATPVRTPMAPIPLPTSPINSPVNPPTSSVNPPTAPISLPTAPFAAPTASNTSTYSIFLDLVNITSSNQLFFTNAKARWESIVAGDVPDIPKTDLDSGPTAGCAYPDVIDDLYICGTYKYIDGLGKILGYSRPLYWRVGLSGLSGQTVTGEMVFDSSDLTYLQAAGNFGTVIQHEMGHILGTLTTKGC
jgi:hypothetical protein